MNKLFIFVGLAALLFGTEASEKMGHSRSQLRNIQEDCKILDTYSNASTILTTIEEVFCDCEEEESKNDHLSAYESSEAMEHNSAKLRNIPENCKILDTYVNASTIPTTIEEVLCSCDEEGMKQNDAATTKQTVSCLDTIGKINILQIYMDATTVPRTIEEIIC